ncbi:hypothetical protein [Nocardia sp. NBC_00511]|uniref:hypothetical protein n=1 Tax=Nocardia sp. NBC_00511 TaxID=2903591 RepID=UPI00386835F2
MAAARPGALSAHSRSERTRTAIASCACAPFDVVAGEFGYPPGEFVPGGVGGQVEGPQQPVAMMRIVRVRPHSGVRTREEAR